MCETSGVLRETVRPQTMNARFAFSRADLVRQLLERVLAAVEAEGKPTARKSVLYIKA